MTYPEISIFLSRAVHFFIQSYPSTYPELSIYLSRDIHTPIHRYPSIYPELSIYLSRDILLDFRSGFGWPCWPLRASAAAVIAAVLHLRKQPLAGAGNWLIEARRRCSRASRSQATELNDSWARIGDDSWPVEVARRGGHHGGPCASVQRRRRRLLRRQIQHCQ